MSTPPELSSPRQSSQNPSSRHRQPSHITVFLGSNTDPKGFEYDAISWARRQSSEDLQDPNLHIHVRLLNKYQQHPSPPETNKDHRSNNLQKDADTAPIVDQLREDTPLQQRVRQSLEAEGIPFSIDTSYSMSEDSVQGYPERIWPYFEEGLKQSGVPEEFLRNITRETVGGVRYVNLTDFGPIIKAMFGPRHFYDALRKAVVLAIQAGKHEGPVPILDSVNCILKRLSDSKETKFELSETNELLLFIPPAGLNAAFQHIKGHTDQTVDFLCTRTDPNRPISTYLNEYLITQSFRRKMFDQIDAWIARDTAARSIHDKFAVVAKTVQQPQAVKKNLQHGFIETSQFISDGADVSTDRAAHADQRRNFDNFLSALDLKFDFGHVTQDGRPYLCSADTVTLKPFDSSNLIASQLHSTLLFSCNVAVQTDPHYRHGIRPIVMNLHGCYERALQASETYTNRGLSANHYRPPAYNKRPDVPIVNVDGIRHRSFAYCDVLDGTDLRAMEKARHQLIEAHSENHYRPTLDTSPPDWFDPNNVPKPDNFTIGIFVSADNENLHLRRSVWRLSAFAAEQGWPLIYGGMEKKPGSDIRLGYLGANGRWLGMCSAHHLLKQETVDGKFAPGAHHLALYGNISRRACGIIMPINAAISKRGGEGTGQEDGLSIVGRILLPKQFGQKTLILSDPCFKSKSLDVVARQPKGATILAFYGEENCRKLLRDPYALADQGLLVATDVDSEMRLLRQCEEQFKDQRLAAERETRRAPRHVSSLLALA